MRSPESVLHRKHFEKDLSKTTVSIKQDLVFLGMGTSMADDSVSPLIHPLCILNCTGIELHHTDIHHACVN